MATSTRQELLRSAESFCNAFANDKPVEEILSHFSTTHSISCFEHGLPALAPFLGRAFTKPAEYLDTVAKYLTYENMKFFAYMIDAETRKVNVQGSARFTWIETHESWDEVFTYVLDFDHEAKITDWNVWADSGAAYLAKVGKLKDLKQ
ncbi:transcription elongation factor S-II [Thelephora ganbajun]|uniref:Transcription elongation factor S-II n=1 Tax=Thelephora ganbajun TaxID=370292 RepID=A0ACB6Z4J8_THEGA|nr:transcription elongation factor S-II [Thelephora ganbajun]